MRKPIFVIIAIIYIASIVLISLFGMEMKIYNEIIPVTNILCLNTTSKNIEVSDDMDTTILKTKFTEPYNKNNNTGTMIQIYWKVEPDNATTKDVDFVFDESNSRIEMYKTADGVYTGLVLFYNKSIVSVKIVSTDGRKVYKNLILWAY